MLPSRMTITLYRGCIAIPKPRRFSISPFRSQGEDATFRDRCRKLEETWTTSPRWKDLKRPYSAADVVQKQGEKILPFFGSLIESRVNSLSLRIARGRTARIEPDGGQAMVNAKIQKPTRAAAAHARSHRSGTGGWCPI